MGDGDENGDGDDGDGNGDGDGRQALMGGGGAQCTGAPAVRAWLVFPRELD